MKAIETKLHGAWIFEIDQYKDDRGYFLVSFNLKKFREVTDFHADFYQDNLSCSKKNVLRGLHYQIKKAQGKLVRIVRGSAQDVIVDLRQSSKTFGQHFSITLTDKNNLSLWIPPGFAHGFLALEDDTHIFYKVTNEYSPEDQRTLLWNDPDLGIDWKNDGKPLLSPKDAEGKLLKTCEKYA
jgi:dTDP-4-dehydrorhamnose 3,5-epimerase